MHYAGKAQADKSAPGLLLACHPCTNHRPRRHNFTPHSIHINALSINEVRRVSFIVTGSEARCPTFPTLTSASGSDILGSGAPRIGARQGGAEGGIY